MEVEPYHHDGNGQLESIPEGLWAGDDIKLHTIYQND